MKKLLKSVVLATMLILGGSAFAQADHGYDLPEMDNMEESETEVVWVSADEIILEEASYPSLDLTSELPKLDEMVQVYFSGAEDLVIEQELDTIDNKIKTKTVKSNKYEPMNLYPIDHGYDLPEMDSIDKM